MAFDSQRRRDPQPLASPGQLALAGLAGVVVAFAVAALLGQALAAAVAGQGWMWPSSRQDQMTALVGLLQGQPGRGLPRAESALLPGKTAVYAGVVFCEVIAVALVAAGGFWLSRFTRADDPLAGMARRGEAAEVLGQGRLRQARDVIRPDLYGRRRRNDQAGRTQ